MHRVDIICNGPNIREIFATTVSTERSKICKSQKCVLGKNHTRIPPSDSSENYLTKSTRNGTMSGGTLRKKKYLSCRLWKQKLSRTSESREPSCFSIIDIWWNLK